jgi:hypothetical protein
MMIAGIVGSVALLVAGAIGGAVFAYLFFRANKNKKAAVDAAVNRARTQFGR